MNRIARLTAAILFASAALILADASTEQVQRALKDQGFYYGEITGQIDADTTAAIRRFQIRNGLKVSGELDAETRKSLGVSASAATAKPPSRPQPTSAPDQAGQRDDSVAQLQPAPRVQPQDSYAPQPGEAQPDTIDVFAGTPFEAAPPPVQQRVIVGAQTLLMRAGYYGSEIDGLFGPRTASALRAYQARIGRDPTGRLDTDTLSALGLLPDQRRPGFARRRRFMRPPPAEFTPDGEPIYAPR